MDLYQGFFIFTDMFHVELKYLVMLFFSAFLIFGCEKPPENPHLTDIIAQDFRNQEEGTSAALVQVEKNLKENINIMATLPAQSNLRHYYKSKNEQFVVERAKLKQQLRYWKVRIENRDVKVVYESTKAFYDGRKIASNDEAQAYAATKKLRQAKVTWDQKKRVAEHKASLSTAPTQAPAGH